MKKWWVVPVGLCVGLIVFVVGGQGKEQVASVHTTVLQLQDVEQTVSCDGVVEVSEHTFVSADVACVVREVLVDVGQQVSVGDPLIRIDLQATQQMHSSEDRVGSALLLATMLDTITSPTDGILLSVDVADGGVIGEGEACITIAARDDLQVRVMIREKLLPSLEIGQSVRISGAGFDKAVYNGHLSEISSAASSGSMGGESVVEGVITLDEGQVDASMRLGLTAKAKVIISTFEEGLLLPYDAIGEDGDGAAYVYLLENDTAVYTEVTRLKEFSDGVLVAEQSLAGRTLVLEPELVTQDGMPIQSVE